MTTHPTPEVPGSTIRAYSDVEYVFEPHSRQLPDVRAYIVALWERRTFMVEMARSDLRGRGSKTSLGNVWSILDPLFMAGIYFFLYSVLRSSSEERMHFLPALIGNLFLFQITSVALGEAGGSIRKAKNLMLNSTFPRALFPIATIYKAFRKYATVFATYIVIFFLLSLIGIARFGIGLAILPLLFVILAVMHVGIALLVSSLVTLVRDAANFMNYVSRILLFATPIIYPVSILPASAQALVGWQPLFPLYASTQTVFLGDVPNPLLILEAAVWAVVLLVAGAWVFLRHEREFALHL